MRKKVVVLSAAKAIMMTYGGPVFLIALGYGLTHFRKNPIG